MHGNLAEALVVYRKAQAAAERLVEIEPRNPARRGDLSAAYIRVGNVLLEQASLDDALAHYREGLVIAKRLATFLDAGNTRWQRDLLAVSQKVGDAQMAQGKLDDALKSYYDSLAVAERLASDRLSGPWHVGQAPGAAYVPCFKHQIPVQVRMVVFENHEAWHD